MMISWMRLDYHYSSIRGLSKGIIVILLNFVDYLEQSVHATLRFQYY
jgi:hypothetical protein